MQGIIEKYLIKLLKTFSDEEFSSFGKFIASPYFNTGHSVGSGQLIKFYDILSEALRGKTPRLPDKEEIFAKLFRGNRYDDRQMRTLLSVFTRLAEKFISVHHADPFENKRVLMDTLSLRGLDKPFTKHYEKLKKITGSGKLLQENYYRKHVLNLLDITFATYRQKEIRYSALSEDFVKYFILHILDIYIKLAIDSRIRNRKYDFILLEEVKSLLNNRADLFEEEPLIRLYFHELMLALNEDESSYYGLVEIKDKMISGLDPIELFNVYILMGNFCIFMQDRGITKFYKEKFALDKEFIGRNVFSIVQFIQYQVFIAVFVNAVSVKQHEWALGFIKEKENMLDPANRKYTINYCMAEYYFSLNMHGDALEQLAKVNFEFSQLKQLAKNLKLKVYFETAAFENAFSLLEASKKQLTREKEMSGKIKELHLKFLKYYEQMLKAKTAGSPHGGSIFEELKQKVSKEKNFSNKRWVLSRL